ncbi:tagaturonate reductase [Muricauda sp. CAU 1633]|uniref:tagaturonate reductase n=1 Tax=Allomuricauda sp. CAU 1633 TaxID=2816036 RepID=UPI001A8CC6BC|nr:tagaturonate reductase [Muricauda sp. CAU 1633]MBO0324098.1 tagaturonate reductase [Muricauda sp. CAU 1633]
MKKLQRNSIGITDELPIKVVQFGEGNFLRAFVDYAFQELNKKANYKGAIAVVQPIEHGLVDMLNSQDGLYTLFMNGIEKGKKIQEKELVSNIAFGINPYTDYRAYLNLAKEENLEFVISNTTEAGIVYVASDNMNSQPPSSFPAKLTVFLYERFKHFNGSSSKGLTIIPCELINYNSDKLKEIVLTYIDDWNLEKEFKEWIQTSNSFHNTLVDRIVPGYPKDEIESYNSQLEYEDKLLVTAEAFFLWVIEGDDDLRRKLPFDKTNLNVKIVDDMQPYRTRKVRILNGAHTSIFALSLMHGNKTVEDTVNDDFTGDFVQKIVFDEVIETLSMDRAELNEFASEVFDRFRNPFIKHMLASLSLNAISKFKVRVLPSILEFISAKKRIPVHLTYAFACLIRYYKGNWNGETIELKDSTDIIEFFTDVWQENNYKQVAEKVLSNTEFWGEDLSKIDGLSKSVSEAIELIDRLGVEDGFAEFNK